MAVRYHGRNGFEIMSIQYFLNLWNQIRNRYAWVHQKAFRAFAGGKDPAVRAEIFSDYELNNHFRHPTFDSRQTFLLVRFKGTVKPLSRFVGISQICPLTKERDWPFWWQGLFISPAIEIGTKLLDAQLQGVKIG